jgi:two-component system, NtrC family, nitrogen regulation response regulator NtrX
MAKILVVDDDPHILNSLCEMLRDEQYLVDEAQDGVECIVKIKKTVYDSIVLDVRMPKMNGMEALDRIMDISPGTPVIMISADADIPLAVDAVRKGAFDFIKKPLDINRLLITLRNAIDKQSLVKDVRNLNQKVFKSGLKEIIGNSEQISMVKDMIKNAAENSACVLITGPNGSGKELVAQWIHEKSERREGPMNAINCAAMPSSMLEGYIFGWKKGAFTDAKNDQEGILESANGGTLFLDEIGDMSLEAQAKLLRVLETRKTRRIGETKDRDADIRVIAATNKDLQVEINHGRFRADLYYRLAVLLIHNPALNERPEDIPMLIEHFTQEICGTNAWSPPAFEKQAMDSLQSLEWFGNIRELRNVVERLLIYCRNSGVVTMTDLKKYVLPFTIAKPKNLRPENN